MTNEEITAAAEGDPDNGALTDDDIVRIRADRSAPTTAYTGPRRGLRAVIVTRCTDTSALLRGAGRRPL